MKNSIGQGGRSACPGRTSPELLQLRELLHGERARRAAQVAVGAGAATAAAGGGGGRRADGSSRDASELGRRAKPGTERQTDKR